jgi:hypothetical protein
MIRGTFIAAVVLLAAWQIDKHFSYGKYSDAVFAIFRQMRHSFG